MAEEYGPALPPGLASSSNCNDESTSKVIGPALPPGMSLPSENDNDPTPAYYESSESTDSDEDDSVVGPMVFEASRDKGLKSVVEEFEQRSSKMKAQLTNESDPSDGPVKRDSWMTELPPEISKNFGLQNRTFSTGKGAARSTGEDNDRSIWTETPESRKEKEKSGKSKKRKREERQITERDQELQQQVDQYNDTKRPKSLLDMHSKKHKKKLKKEKKKEKKEKKKRKERGEKEVKVARRPFDRDNDLQVNKFDDAQRKLMIQKSQVLNTRFSKGATTSHFL